MIHEQRQYTISKLFIVIVGGLIFTLFGVMSWRLGPVLYRAVFPTTMHCGCSLLAVHTSNWFILIASLLIVVLGYSLIRFFWRGVAILRTTRQVERQYHVHRYRQIDHANLHEEVRILSIADPLALTLGFFRPRVYLSEGLIRTLRNSEVAAVIRHEQAHRQSFDPFWSLILEMMTAAWHWIPGVRGIMAVIYTQREVAADAVATNGYQTVAALSGAFLALHGATHHPAVAAFSPNEERLEKLLDRSWQTKQHWWKRRTVVALAGIISGVILFGTMVVAGTGTPPRAASICHQAIVMCQQSPSQTVPVRSCAGMTCVTLEHYATPAYASHQ